MASYVKRKAPEAIDAKVSEAIFRGEGTATPLGILASPCLVTQEAEGGQTAGTVNAQNVSKMHARLPVGSRRRAVWLVHPDVDAQLPSMMLNGQPIYSYPRDENSYGRLLGNPVIPHQVCSPLGDLGDIVLADFRQYMAILKAGGVRLLISLHIWFDHDLQAWMFTMRLAGQPWWAAPIAPRVGASTISPFVALTAR